MRVDLEYTATGPEFQDNVGLKTTDQNYSNSYTVAEVEIQIEWQ